jgi:tetratricopeptide (TPR) repeat protein
MPVSHDAAFGSTAVEMRVLTSEQVSLGGKIQKVLADLGISKTLAVIAVEAGWMDLDQALVIVTGLRRQGVAHPEVKPRPAADADDAVLDRLSPSARKRLETASRTLASLFYARGAGTLALDQGSPAPAKPQRAAPEPTPTPVRRVQPAAIPPPKKSGAVGAIVAVLAAVLAIGAFIATRPKAVVPEPEPPPIARKPPPAPKPPPPPAPPAPPPPAAPADAPPPTDSSMDDDVEAARKKHIQKLEQEAALEYEAIKTLLAEDRPASALGRLKRFIVSYEWADFYKQRKDEIARLLKETEEKVAGAMSEGIDQGPDMSAEGPPLPALAAAFKRLDDAAAADLRRSLSARARLAGWKSDLALRSGKIVKGAEVVDVTREDLRVRGEIDGAKIDVLLSWSALDAPSFLNVQRQIAKGQGASGLFEMGRAAILRRLWKDAKAAFEECARADAAWKPRLPDLAAVFADASVLRGAAGRLADGRLFVEYSFLEADQAADFTPMSGGGTLSVAGGTLKVAAKEPSLWSLKDLTLAGDADLGFVFEGSGEASVGFDKAVFHFSAAGLKTDLPGFATPAVPGRPVTFERRDRALRLRQNGTVLFTGTIPEGPVKPVIGGRGEVAVRDFWVAGVADGTELSRRLGPLERLEGGALAGDFKLDPLAMDADSFTRAAAVEAALEAGQIEEALTLAEESIAKTPAEGLAVAVRGLVRLAQGEARLAMEDADLAIALDPCRGDVVARARRILGKLRGAVPGP